MSEVSNGEASYSAESGDTSTDSGDLESQMDAGDGNEASSELMISQEGEADEDLCEQMPPPEEIPNEDTTEETAVAEIDNDGADKAKTVSETAEKDKACDNDTAEAKADRAEIVESSEYSDEINDRITSREELEVYQKAGLKETTVEGKTCLVRDSIDMDYVDPKTGKTNRELMEAGRAPYDAKTGEKLELHHIGQDSDSPLAELTADSEHGKFYSVLHTSESDSWRNDEKKNNHYNNVERPNHWKARVKED